MLINDIITKKRDKKELTQAEIEFFVSGVTDGSIPDYQISALLMSMFLNGLNDNETSLLTLSMANSGDMLDLSFLGERTVDKHSTGGVGDKTTLIAAPIAAVLGCKVAKMSGRGLGFTGGTVDKLESITGYKTKLSTDEFLNCAEKHGICLMGQSGNFTPADKKIYALRDVTSTVESIPLIASSIMSKKIAAGAKSLVLDVKCGSGAFMKTSEEAEKLARKMIAIGKSAGIKVSVLITDMSAPLGKAIGNSLEVKEACEILKGEGDERLTELCLSLAANMYSLAFEKPLSFALSAAKEALENGAAFKKFCEMTETLGGDVNLLTGKSNFKKAAHSIEIKAEKSGFISSINSELIGAAAALTGAGRMNLDEKIDHSAGIVLNFNVGDEVLKGKTIATLYGEKEKCEMAANKLLSAFSFSSKKPKLTPIILKTIKG